VGLYAKFLIITVLPDATETPEEAAPAEDGVAAVLVDDDPQAVAAAASATATTTMELLRISP
jgi:hypothetical protein